MNEEKTNNIDDKLKATIVELLGYMSRSTLLTLLGLITALLEAANKDENKLEEGEKQWTIDF